MGEYTAEHARGGLGERLPSLETWPNQFPDYEVVLTYPEFTSVCPRTGLADFGTITIQYMPGNDCLETKSLRLYFQAYRNLGIFQENAVNRILEDVVAAARPRWAVVLGEFNPRGGMACRIEARFPRAVGEPTSTETRPARGHRPTSRRSAPSSRGI